MSTFVSIAGAKIPKGAIVGKLTAALSRAVLPKFAIAAFGHLNAVLGRHWWVMKLLGVGGGWTGLALSLLMFVAPYAIGPLGIIGKGPVAGTVLAGAQAMYGGAVPAGSVFAVAQSFAMGGRMGLQAVAAWQTAWGIGAAASGAVTALFKFL